MNIRTLLLAFFLLLSCNAEAALLNDSFINQSYGAHTIAIGEAATALHNDPENVYFNPAANGFVKDLSIKSSYSDYYGGAFMQGSLACALPVQGMGVLTAAVPFRIVNDIPVTGVDNEGVFVETSSTKELAAAGLLSWSSVINDTLAVGATVKYLRQKLYTEASSGFGYDLGMQYKVRNPFADITLGISLLDIGNTRISWSTGHNDYLAMTSRLGIALEKEIFDGKMLISCDTIAQENASKLSAGISYQYSNLILMGGLQNKDGATSFSYGLGIAFGGMQLDYASQGNDVLGNTSKVSLGINF